MSLLDGSKMLLDIIQSSFISYKYLFSISSSFLVFGCHNWSYFTMLPERWSNFLWRTMHIRCFSFNQFIHGKGINDSVLSLKSRTYIFFISSTFLFYRTLVTRNSVCLRTFSKIQLKIFLFNWDSSVQKELALICS